MRGILYQLPIESCAKKLIEQLSARMLVCLFLVCQALLLPAPTPFIQSASAQSGSIAAIDTNSSPLLPDIAYDYTIENLPSHLRAPTIGTISLSIKNNPNINHLATLGRVLFYDKNLSRNRLVSCASCHKQGNGFDDPSRFSIGFEGKITSRNAMGLSNLIFNSDGQFFWDKRAKSLEEQVLTPFFDAIEMGLEKGELVERAKSSSYYANLFNNAFGNSDITTKKISAALVQFVASIISTQSPYDMARQDVESFHLDFPAFSKRQNRGKFLFFSGFEDGGAGCSNCHVTQSFVSLARGANNGLDLDNSKDGGIGAINARTSDLGKFRPPSLRNIAARPPYMHDGRFATLEEVIEHYSTGIKNNPNLDPFLKDKQAIPLRLDLNKNDKDALVVFLNTLSDPTLMSDPKFADPFR